MKKNILEITSSLRQHPGVYPAPLHMSDKAEWHTLIGRELYRSEIFSLCCDASSIGGHFACSSLVLYGIRELA